MELRKIAASLLLIASVLTDQNADASTFEDTCNISFYASKVAVYLKESDQELASNLLDEISTIKKQLEGTISNEIAEGRSPTDCLTLALEELEDAPNAYEATQRYLSR